MFSTGSLTLQDSTVSHSQAAATGGGLAIRSGTLNAARDAIVDNSAGPDQGPGGGITVGAGTSCCSMTDSTIANNSATGPDATGGVVVSGVSDASGVSEGALRLYGDTIAGNPGPRGRRRTRRLFCAGRPPRDAPAQNSGVTVLGTSSGSFRTAVICQTTPPG